MGHSRRHRPYPRRSPSRESFLEMDLVYQSSACGVRFPDDPTVFGCPQSKDPDLGRDESDRLVRDCNHAGGHTHDVTRPRLWGRDISLELAQSHLPHCVRCSNDRLFHLQRSQVGQIPVDTPSAFPQDFQYRSSRSMLCSWLCA
jgi:hypothetical protein